MRNLTLTLLALALSTSIAAAGAPPPVIAVNSEIITGAGAQVTHVKVFDGTTGGATASFFAYPGTNAGVRVAAGDITGDGFDDVITGANTANGHVKVFDGLSGAEVRSFLAFPGFTGGVYVASGDVTGDGRADIVTGADAGGGPHVKVFDGLTNGEASSFFAYGPTFSGGVRVAAGDINGDSFDDIITGAGAGAPGGHVKVFDGQTGGELRSFFAYEGFSGGIYVASGDVNGDGRDDIITGAGSGAPGGHVKVFDGQTGLLQSSFLAYPTGFSGGVRVASADINGDLVDDIITGGGPGSAGGHVKVFNGQTLQELRSFLAYDGDFNEGVYVAGASNPVPEPASGALLIAGLAGLAVARKRARR